MLMSSHLIWLLINWILMYVCSTDCVWVHGYLSNGENCRWMRTKKGRIFSIPIQQKKLTENLLTRADFECFVTRSAITDTLATSFSSVLCCRLACWPPKIPWMPMQIAIWWDFGCYEVKIARLLRIFSWADFEQIRCIFHHRVHNWADA
jgi:hypothetical protein